MTRNEGKRPQPFVLSDALTCIHYIVLSTSVCVWALCTRLQVCAYYALIRIVHDWSD